MSTQHAVAFLVEVKKWFGFYTVNTRKHVRPNFFVGMCPCMGGTSISLCRSRSLILSRKYVKSESANSSSPFSLKGEVKCPANKVITGVWDSERDFKRPKKAKCSALATGTVDVDDPNCENTERHAASNTAIYW